jgi:uncharacterized protein GlcG (DUF336 family)
MRLKVALLVLVGVGLVYWPLHSRADDGDGSGDGGDPLAATTNPNDPTGLTAAEVDAVVQAAAASVNSTQLVIAVTNRRGDVLAVYRKPDAPVQSLGNFGIMQDSNEVAVALARTASFFSNSQAPLSSRTVRFISGVHFPPGISFTPTAALYGIENTNRGCQLAPDSDFNPGQKIPPSRSIDGSTTGLGILTGKPDVFDGYAKPGLVNADNVQVNPGGVPLFKNDVLVGGVGVTGVTTDIAEFAALSGNQGLVGFDGGVSIGLNIPPPAVVVIDGIALPFVNQGTRPAGLSAGTASGSYLRGPSPSPGPAPEGYLVGPMAGPLGGLTAAEVDKIVQAAIDMANQTRAVIRLPLGTRAKFVIAIADLDGKLIALNRMHDATIFSVDVAASKARNVIYFSGKDRPQSDLPQVPIGTAMTNRSIEWASQPFYPPGIDYSGPGAFFNFLYKNDVANPCSQGSDPRPNNKSGIVFFPGALPLYRNGVMIGGLGVSGDGVEQDDFDTQAAAAGFEAPVKIRADQVFVDGARLPYIKFPRNPTF